ncbi:MAG: sigma-54 dependent transcriptional regulator [Planctomycetota bacterium]
MSEPIRIVVVDDEAPFRDVVCRKLRREGFEVTGFGEARGALEWLERSDVDVALLDIRMPGMSGIELLEAIRERRPWVEVIMLTGQGSVDTAIRAMKLGAYDYLEKPHKISKLALLIRKAAERRQLARENTALRRELRSHDPFSEIVGASEAMESVRGLVTRFAATKAPVLITGESGTGKELVARTLHRRSSRSEQPFLAVNCGALPETLLENELFGHASGAFTGADTAVPGIFESADGGTLFIDEIGEMSLSMQTRFLRVLETGELTRLGDHRPRRVDVRIIAATNRVIETEVHSGAFRTDLYYRLNVLRIELAPLRDRIEDLQSLVPHLLRLICEPSGSDIPELEPAVWRAFEQHSWPGNVRELRNLLERGVILARDGRVCRQDLPGLESYSPKVQPVLNGEPLLEDEAQVNGAPMSLAEMERHFIERTLQAAAGNKTEAARRLGISLRSLYRKLDKS